MHKLKAHAKKKKKLLKIKQTKNPKQIRTLSSKQIKTKKPKSQKPISKQRKQKQKQKQNENPHLLSPSSKIDCSSAVHSTERPGLCFSAWADPELSDAPAFVAPKLPLLVFLLPPPLPPPPPLKEDEALLPS